MIWHFFEVWFLILGTFIVGCGLGAALYNGIGNSGLAMAQGRVADAVGDVVDGVKARFGLGPDWREGFRMPVQRPMPKPKVKKRREEPRFVEEDDYDYADPPAAPPRSADDYREEEEWSEDDNWREDRHPETDDTYYEEEVERLEDTLASEALPALLPAEVQALEDVSPQRPAGLLGPRNGVPDHLQRIRGIGKGNEELLNSLGIYHFGQIAAWTPAEVRWVASHLPFPERIERDDWVGQAIVLASGGDTGYVKSAERRRARRAGEAAAEDQPPEE
jgi:predicted flap endonuclease-1-like 5' DNA nuclease